MTVPTGVISKAKTAAQGIQGDVFVYNSPITSGVNGDLKFVEAVFKGKRSDTATLFLTTNGGDPDAGYKMARYLQDRYESWTVVISGRCKSAGTLVAIGANEIAFAPYGELGPLDVQLAKIDRFDQLQSGLTIQDALNTLEERAVDRYHKVTKSWIVSNQGLMSFASASRSAGDFVAQLYAPIFQRIDPEEVGSRTRNMRIATDYGSRLALKGGNLKADTLRVLAETYSSHSFVIDQREAEGLFVKVRSVNEAEKAVMKRWGDMRVSNPGLPIMNAMRYISLTRKPRATEDPMTKLTEQEIRRRMAEILREQMERPALRPLPHLEGGEKDQLGSTPESHQRNPRPKRKTDIELDIFA